MGNLPTLSGVFLGSESLNNQETRLSLVIWSFGPLDASKNSFLSCLTFTAMDKTTSIPRRLRRCLGAGAAARPGSACSSLVSRAVTGTVKCKNVFICNAMNRTKQHAYPAGHDVHHVHHVHHVRPVFLVAVQCHLRRLLPSTTGHLVVATLLIK